jgi:predicted adenine nucleotide alpha hydrolase (AANH) superfamily ATPase
VIVAALTGRQARAGYNRTMDGLFLHACCGPCATVAVPAWRSEGLEPSLWFWNPNIQPDAEHARRRDSFLRFAAAEEVPVVPLIEYKAGARSAAWGEWAAALASLSADERCRRCLSLRLDSAAEAAAAAGAARFSTTLSVSPYQRHDLIRTFGSEAGERHGIAFVYRDLRPHFRESYAESRRLGLYRQPYCGCVASKWEAWGERRARRKAG